MNPLTDRMDTCFYCDQWVIVERYSRNKNNTFNVSDGTKHKCPDYRKLEI